MPRSDASDGRRDRRGGPGRPSGDGAGQGRDAPRPRGNRGGADRERAEPRPGDPIGRDTANRRADAPPRGLLTPRQRDQRVPEPPLATTAPEDLPKGIRRELSKATDNSDKLRRLQQHTTAALAALDEGDGQTAVPHLQWVKQSARRSGAIREALGVALYLTQRYPECLTELATYRRITGHADQNHLVADARRAIGEGTDRIPELIEEMVRDDEVTPEALAEGHIVWASWIADRGDLGAARALLAPFVAEVPEQPEEHHLRLLYVDGDLAARAGDTASAKASFERIVAVADGFFDAEERAAGMTG